MPNGTLRGVRGRGNYLVFLPTRFFIINGNVNISIDNKSIIFKFAAES